MDGGRAGSLRGEVGGRVASDAQLASALQRLEYEDFAEARRMGPGWEDVQRGRAWWEAEAEVLGRMRDRASALGAGREEGAAGAAGAAGAGRPLGLRAAGAGTSLLHGLPPPRRRELRLEPLTWAEEEALASTSVPGGANPSVRHGGREVHVAGGAGGVEDVIDGNRRMLDACRVRTWPSSPHGPWVPSQAAGVAAAGRPTPGTGGGVGGLLGGTPQPPSQPPPPLKRARSQEDFAATSIAIRQRLNSGGCIGIPRTDAPTARPARAPPPDELDRARDRARLERVLHDYGLCEREVAGDGNCLFRAVADQLFRDGGEAHAWVRQLAADQLRLHRDAYEGFVVLRVEPPPPPPTQQHVYGGAGVGGGSGGEEETWDGYCQRVGRLGTWGDHVCIQALADALGAQFNILSSYAARSCIEVPPGQASGAKLAVRDRHLFLSFHAEVHYGSVWPQGEAPPPSRQASVF